MVKFQKFRKIAVNRKYEFIFAQEENSLKKRTFLCRHESNDKHNHIASIPNCFTNMLYTYFQQVFSNS